MNVKSLQLFLVICLSIGSLGTADENEEVTVESTEAPPSAIKESKSEVKSEGKVPEKEKPPVKELRVGVKHRVQCEESEKTKKGDKLSIHYTGTLYASGEKFDSSLDRGNPFEFTLGKGQVIVGYERGLVGMCKGEKRRLTIPSDLGYGARGSPPKIPPDAALVFEVELLDIIRTGAKEEL